MKVLLILAAVIGVTFSLDDEWARWKAQYDKSYDDEALESVRRLVWEDNLRFVQQHNSEGHSFEVEMNEFADLTSEEFAKLYLSKINMANSTESGSEEFPFTGNEPVPDEVDWRTKGVVTPVKNQGQCGSCWAFSATGSLEGQHALKAGKLVSLSEQNLIDCSKKAGNAGCDGGLMNNAFEYIKDNGGLDTEECYPYRAEDEKCRYKSSCSGATDSGHTNVLRYDERALKTAVAKVGPISVGIDARWGSFQLYKSGVYDEKKCSSFKLDHGVLAVGYGTYKGTDYWLVKNSWGTRWGMKGYIMMSRDKHNQCGIASQASYPKVKG